MSVFLLPMSPVDFERFRIISLKHHAEELIAEEHFNPDAAAEEAESELRSMLPSGLQTQNNYLYSIIDDEKVVGFLWFLVENTDSVLQAFLCDFYIAPEYRREGRGKTALGHYHALAAKRSCSESVLYVSDANSEAKRLYQRCGYSVLRDHNYGCFMVKVLR